MTPPNSRKNNERNGAIVPPLLPRLEAAFSLPSALARVAQYVFEHPEKVVRQSLIELSTHTNSGQASVMRLCRELGFKGFTDFKLTLAAELALENSAQIASESVGYEPVARASHDICRSVEATSQLLDPEVLAFVAAKLVAANHTSIYGSRESGLIAEIFNYRLTNAKLRVGISVDARLAQTAASNLDTKCAAIAISQSGVSSDTLEFAEMARHAGAFTIAVTCHPTAALGMTADIVLPMGRYAEPAYRYRIIDFPRAILVAEAIGLAVDKHRSSKA